MNASWLPHKVEEVVFSDAFEPVEGEDHADSGPVLGSLARLATMAAANVGLGDLRALGSWGGGRGFYFQRSKGRVNFALYEGVGAWEDIVPDFASEPGDVDFEPPVPLFSPRAELLALLAAHKPVEWYSVRHGKGGDWANNVKSHIVDRDKITKTVAGMAKVDLILNAQQFPRSRLLMHFDKGRLWIFSGPRGDALAICSKRGGGSHQMRIIARYGEAFKLT